jgi:hypothetical protein
MKRVIAYNDIQSNSAVRRRWRAVFVLTKTLKINKKKKRNNRFRSPNNING